MPFHKLADGPITMVIGKISATEGKFGPQMVFTSTSGMDVFISELSGAKGLARLNLTPESAIGETLTFEQIRKDGKTFTNINKGGVVGAVSAPATSTSSTASYHAALSFEDAVALYGRCVEAALDQLAKRCELSEIPVDASAVQAAAATLFIAIKGR
jgi:hypothetical protein